MGRFDAWVRSQGTDPDPRFTLANERTFLTWITASLGMLGIGLAVDTILPQDSRPIDALALAWVVVSAVLAVRAMVRWLRLERAMRLGEGLPLSTSIPIVAITIAFLGLLSGIAVIAAS
jgi:putative membrane protein